MPKSILTLALMFMATLAQAEAAPSRLVVHEWGTFTNFAGADGAYLDYRPLIGSDLPAFVFDRQRQAALTQTIIGSALSKASISTRSRMETPVTYFYTDQPMALRVLVEFPRGLLTEFYPPARFVAPAIQPGETTPAIGNALLNWGEITVFPESQLEPARRHIPAVNPADPYAAARETDSDIVWATNVTGNYMEKFLFYRGVGNFDLPVSMRSLGADRFTIRNAGREPIHAAFLVQVSDGKVRFTRVGAFQTEANLTLSREPRTLDALCDAMAADLVADGLFEKEARAMVNTWKSSWFGEDGTRLLYLLPQSFTDKELPLKIDPKPDLCLRVMVGRLETLTPEMEQRIARLLQQLSADDCAEREEAARQLHLLGRFAEPALKRIGRALNDAAVQQQAEQLLASLRAEN